jgi:hypothetical protein
MRIQSIVLFLAATVPLVSSSELLRGGGRELQDAQEAKQQEKEFEGVKVVPMKDSGVQIGRKAKVPPGFKKNDLIEKKESVTIQFKEGGTRYKRPLVSPGSCCCACKELPCECACDVEFDTKLGYPKLGRIVGGPTEESSASRRKREKAEGKAKRKAERKRLKIEQAKKDKGGRLLRSRHRHLKVHPLTNLVHYKDSSVLMSCGQCESFPCTSKATILVFRYDTD